MSSSCFNGFLLFIISFSLMNGYALGGRNLLVESDEYQTFDITSLLSTSTCQPSVQGRSRPASLKVTHTHGPCSKLGNKNIPIPAEVLAHDQIRVASIQKRHASNSKVDKSSVAPKSIVTIPAKSGLNGFASANYVVSVGLGTPAKYLNLEFDTGSSLIWTQCEPCVKSCYTQQDPIFNPSASSSYSNVSCNSAECSQLPSNTGNEGDCSESTCIYLTTYGDHSFSVGFLGNERLTLTPNDEFDEMVFGCGEYNSLIGNSSTSPLQDTTTHHSSLFLHHSPTLRHLQPPLPSLFSLPSRSKGCNKYDQDASQITPTYIYLIGALD